MTGADCGTDHNLLIADVKIKFKRIKRSKPTPKYDVEKHRYGVCCRSEEQVQRTPTGG